MTEKTPIKAADIRKGDLIRVEYDAKYVIDRAHEYVASGDRDPKDVWDGTYFLLDRPVVLPTVPGVYTSSRGTVYKLDPAGDWWCDGGAVSKEAMSWLIPLTRLMTEAEWEGGK